MIRLLPFVLLLLVLLYLVPAGLGAVRQREARRASGMSRSEALEVLGLGDGATEKQILTAYRQLIRKVHPDTPGGSTYLAAQINQARKVLLG